MDLRPVGVNGILAVLGDSISEQTGAQVAALREAIADAHISSVEETIPAYASLLVKYDPFLTDYAALCDRLRALEKRLSASAVQTGKIVEIPVCYGGVYGEDSCHFCRQTRGAERKRCRRAAQRPALPHLYAQVPAGVPVIWAD